MLVQCWHAQYVDRWYVGMQCCAGAGLEMTRELLPSLRSLVASPLVAAEMQSLAAAPILSPSSSRHRIVLAHCAPPARPGHAGPRLHWWRTTCTSHRVLNILFSVSAFRINQNLYQWHHVGYVLCCYQDRKVTRYSGYHRFDIIKYSGMYIMSFPMNFRI